jgi:16S rRNA (guanine527-N7)-methyltransferase
VSTPQPFLDAVESLELSIEAPQLEKLGAFLDHLLETNKKFNLTGVRDRDEAWMRHILDSLSLLPFLGDARRIVDVGSGGGLPAIPLAIMEPDRAFTALEATGKKARFIAEAAALLELENMEVVNDRAEDAGQDPQLRERFDLAIARAIGPMPVLLELLLPLVSVGGRVLAMKGTRAEQELRGSGDALMALGGGEVGVHESLPEIEPDAVVVEVIKDHATPNEFPRRPGVPKKEPL